MPNIMQTIARENFRNSGFLSHPGKDRRINWEYVAPPSNPFRRRTDSINDILERRDAAMARESKSSPIKFLLNAFLRR